MRRVPSKPGKALAVLLAIAVHLALGLFLIFGVHWQNKQPETMMVELVPPPTVQRQLQPVPMPTPPPPPEPRPVPPEPPKVEPKVEPRVEPPKAVPPPQPAKADIALKARQEREKLEKERIERDLAEKIKRDQDRIVREQRERELREMAKKEVDKREREAQDRARRETDLRVLEETKLAQDRAQKEAEEKRRRDELARVEREQREQRDKAAATEAAAKAATSKAFNDYVTRIQAKIRGNVILPPEVGGNPEAVFEVVQLPTGEIISAELRKSSGSRVYDDAVSRAILKSSPLPKPDSPDLFQRSLTLKFRPQS